MPRGKYDRKASKIQRLEKALLDSTKKSKDLNVELEKKDVELKATKKLADVVKKSSDPTTLPKESFDILRDNLRTLSEARRVLVDSDQISPEVLSEIDGEITAHLRLLGALRVDSFPEQEKLIKKTAKQASPAPISPTMPQFFAQGAGR